LAVLQCPSPPNIKNGQHESKGVTVFIPGMSVKYSCDPGYVLTRKTTVSCLTSGTWSIPYPRCEAVKCLPPPRIANGEHSSHFSDTFDVGARVQYHCKHGFSLVGNKSVHCTTYGVWSLPLPRCEGVL
ncbi:CR2 protein, partial [Podargus strigoides]|nr:CR2 protein [Podargus strigoides]